ncbi:hypothetical protein RHOER0001_4942 [Rhodococcus erythropolis SK121]|nr:hypothetical protein RHOER0001_4942 [Rhodococcus erythropolis SK121]
MTKPSAIAIRWQFSNSEVRSRLAKEIQGELFLQNHARDLNLESDHSTHLQHPR